MIAWETVFPFWDTLSDLQKMEVLDRTIISQYSEGARIKKREGLYLVNDGRILIYIQHDNGRRRVLLSADKQEVLILTREFIKVSADITMEMYAAKESEIHFIPQEGWESLETAYPDIHKYTVEKLSQEMGVLSSHLYGGLGNIVKQLATFLLREVKRNNNSVIEISHEHLAEILGTTREVVTRNISVLKQQGYIGTGRNRITILDAGGLEEFIKETD